MGLLGKNISYSFSRGYFTEKFAKEELSDHGYVNFDIQSIDEFPSVIREFKNHLKGLNVTIPYKQDVIPFLDKLDPVAEAIGAVNTIVFRDGEKIGYNTDYIGFKKTILQNIKIHQD